MKKDSSKYELLAPAGGFSQLVAAVNAGADAVYFGLKEFSMRVNAKNFEIKDLDKINQICKNKVKKYLTINIIIYDEELDRVEKALLAAKDKIDAVICWDLSVINLCKKHLIPFHISTQASISNSPSAKFYKDLGAERIVLARELSLEQINNISKNVDIEIEAFCHGAMCVAISGRCFMSQHLFKRSANRGMCTQVCRRSYTISDSEGRELSMEKHTIMSAKDLCTLPFIDKLKESGITVFKIEGRSRDTRYVDVVVRAYRKALDSNLAKEELENLLSKLNEVYTKGSSSGFYLGTPTSDDFSDVENSKATKKKIFVGKVTHYYPNKGVATILIQSEPISVGDDIAIIGNTTGIVNQKISSMQIDLREIESAKKTQEVGIKINKKTRPGDEVYVIKNN